MNGSDARPSVGPDSLSGVDAATEGHPGVTIRRRRRRAPHHQCPDHEGADAAPAQLHPPVFLSSAGSSRGQPSLQTAALLQLPCLQDTLAGGITPDHVSDLPKLPQ